MFLASRMFLLFPICIQQPVYCGEKTFTSIMEENRVVANSPMERKIGKLINGKTLSVKRKCERANISFSEVNEWTDGWMDSVRWTESEYNLDKPSDTDSQPCFLMCGHGSFNIERY